MFFYILSKKFLFFFITFIEVIFPLISLTFISNSYIRSINSIIIMWLLLSIRYQIKSFTLKNTTTLNYEILKKNWIYKHEMEEMILFNEMKMPVGASSERLMSESLRRFFNWQIHQMFMDIHSKHWIIQQWIGWLLCDALWFRQKCKWPNIIVFAHWTVYITIKQS